MYMLYPKVTWIVLILRKISNWMFIEGSIMSLVFDVFIISFLWQVKDYVYKFGVLEIYFMKEIRIKVYVQFTEDKVEIIVLAMYRRVNYLFIILNLTLSFLLSKAKSKQCALHTFPYVCCDKNHDSWKKCFSEVPNFKRNILYG